MIPIQMSDDGKYLDKLSEHSKENQIELRVVQ